MRRYVVRNTATGVLLGVYAAHDARGALNALARDAGYSDHAAACRVAPVGAGELEVVELATERARLEAIAASGAPAARAWACLDLATLGADDE